MQAKIQHRISAFSLDVTIVFMLTSLMIHSIRFFLARHFVDLSMMQIGYISRGLDVLLIPMTVFYTFCYFFYANYFASGRSIGCIWYDLTVVNQDFEEMTFREAFRRSMMQTFYLFSFMTFVTIPLLLLPLFRKDKRGIADILSSTATVTIEGLEKYQAPIYLPLQARGKENPIITDNVIYLDDYRQKNADEKKAA